MTSRSEMEYASYVENKVATIVPIAHLDEIADHTRFMALTHLMGNSRYREFYRAQVLAGKWVIFDNSTVELGQPENLEAYLTKAMQLEASEILLPDYLFDARRTLSAMNQGLNSVQLLGFTGRVMGVPQGVDQNEWLHCALQMVDAGVGSIGISRRYVEKFGNSRLFACYAVRNICDSLGRKDTVIHLLGSQGYPELDAPCLALSYVEGIDSALPSYFAKQDRFLGPGLARPFGVRLDFEKDLYEAELLSQNIRSWRKLCVPADWGGQSA